MEEERQEEQEQRAMAVQAGGRCCLGNYMGWPAQDLVSQRLLFSGHTFCRFRARVPPGPMALRHSV